MREYPARLIEEEAASGEHARGQVRGEKGRGRQETRGVERKECRRQREDGLGESQDQVAGQCSPWLICQMPV